jgi:cytochrome c oxidase assembly factor CtaG
MRGVERLRIAIAITITVLWVGATVLDATSSTYDVPSNLQNLMMLVAGFLFTPSVIRAATRRSERSDDE